MTTLAHVPAPEYSATQISTWWLCKRKWGWRKLEGLEPPPGGAAALGSEVHEEQLEPWLRDARPLDLTRESGEIAMAGLHLLPAPKTPGLEVEREFHVQIAGHVFGGRKDFEILQRDPPLVGDHKTTSDFRWMKDADTLRSDPQACLYAAEAMHRTGAGACDLHWVYYKTRGARAAHRVHLRVTREDVTPTIQRMVAAADEMTGVRRAGLRARDLPPNANACEAFGGCEYTELCGLTPQERMQSIMAQHSTFLQSLGAQGINPPANVQPYPPAAPAAPAMPPAAAPAAALPPPGPAPVPYQDPQTGQWVLPPQPPVAPPPGPAPVYMTPPPTAPAAAPPVAAPVAPPAEAPKRKRRTKSEMATAAGAPVAASVPGPIEVDDESEDGGELKRARAATFLRQTSSMLATVAAMLEAGDL